MWQPSTKNRSEKRVTNRKENKIEGAENNGTCIMPLTENCLAFTAYKDRKQL